MSRLTESVVEDAAISWFVELGYSYLPGPEMAADGENPERADYMEPLCWRIGCTTL